MELIKYTPVILLLSILTACNDTIIADSGCLVYESRLASLPRPIEDTSLGRWVAGTDSAMLATCRRLSSENWYE